MKTGETLAIVAGLGVCGAIVYYVFFWPKDEGTLVLDLDVPPIAPDESTICTIDGNQVATSLLMQTGVALRAGVHTFAMQVDDDDDGEFQMMVQSQFQIQPKVRTRLHVRSDYGTEETYE